MYAIRSYYAEGDQVAQRRNTAVVDQIGIALVIGLVAGTYRGMDRLDHVRVVGVVFALELVLQQAAGTDRLTSGPGFLRQDPLLFLEVLELGTLDAAGDALEAVV